MRTKTPSRTEAAVLLACRRRCSLCFGLHRDAAQKDGQIAHIDRDPNNTSEQNITWLCLQHHHEYDSRSRQAKGHTKAELKAFKIETEDFIAEIFNQMKAINLYPNNNISAEPIGPPLELKSWRVRATFTSDQPMKLASFLGSDITFSANIRAIIYEDKLVNFRTLLEYGDSNIYIPNDVSEIASYVSSDGALYVYARDNGSIAVYPLYFEEEIRAGEAEVIPAHSTKASCGAFNESADLFISGNIVGEIALWDWKKRRIFRLLHSVIGSINSLYLSAAQDRLVAICEDGGFELFEYSTGVSLGSGRATLRGSGAHMIITPDNKYLVGTDGSDRVDVISLSSLRQAERDEWLTVWRDFVLVKDKIVILNAAGQLVAADAELSPPEVAVLTAADERVTEFRVNDDWTRVAALIGRKHLKIWERIRDDAAS